MKNYVSLYFVFKLRVTFVLSLSKKIHINNRIVQLIHKKSTLFLTQNLILK